jgi:hypothetical protein
MMNLKNLEGSSDHALIEVQARYLPRVTSEKHVIPARIIEYLLNISVGL